MPSPVSLSYAFFMNEPVLSILGHRTHKPAARAQITLQQNMFTFLLEGEKTVHFAGTQVTVKPHQFIMLAAGNCLMSEKLAAKEAADEEHEHRRRRRSDDPPGSHLTYGRKPVQLYSILQTDLRCNP